MFRVTFLLLAAMMPLCTSEAFHPGEVWNDTDGKPIQAHGGGVLFHEGTYYWYGENKAGPTKPGGCGARVDVIGVSCYSSQDLLHWKNEGVVLPAVADDESHDLHTSKVVERPKVLYNVKTRRFVMWMHIDRVNYEAAMSGVAIADRPTGPFTYLEGVRALGGESRDQTVFQDDDGTAYRIYSSENNTTTRITRLSDDYLHHTQDSVRVFAGRSMEAATMVKCGGKYWFIASGCNGWAPNAARSAVADRVMGPWKELGNPCHGVDANITFGGQSTFLLPVAGKPGAVILLLDRWNAKDLQDSRYVWLPLEWREDGAPRVAWRDFWDLRFFDRP
jgi:beta-galactosidase